MARIMDGWMDNGWGSEEGSVAHNSKTGFITDFLRGISLACCCHWPELENKLE